MKGNIHVSTKGLRNYTKPKIKTVVSNLSTARSNLLNIEMPDNFSYATQLKNDIPNQIQRIEKDIAGINSFISRKTGEFEKVKNATKKTESDLGNILSKFSADFGEAIYGIFKQTSTKNMTNNPDYEYYYKTQAGNLTANNSILYPYSDAYLERQYSGIMGQLRSTNAQQVVKFLSGTYNAIKNMGQMNVYASSTKNNSTLNATNNIQIQNEVYEIGGDAIQGGCYNGESIILSIGKKVDGVDNGVIIAKYNFETEDLEKIMDLDEKVGIERAGHGEGITYDSNRNVILCRNYNDLESTIFEIDIENKEINEVKIPHYFGEFAYSKERGELIGLSKSEYYENGRTITCMKYDDKEKAYVETDVIEINNNFTNIQGIACNKNVIYFADTNRQEEMNPENYRIWGCDFEGNIVEEHRIESDSNKSNFFNNLSEVENVLFLDDSDEMYLIMQWEIVQAKSD